MTLAHAHSPKLAPGVTIIAEGDSLTYGQDTTSAGLPTQINGASHTRSISPFPEELGKAVASCAKVSNHGFPGDRSVDGLVRWQSAPQAEIYVIMYGTNDAFNGGRSATGALTPETYAQVLELLARRRMVRGAKIVIMSPPPVKAADREVILQPYEETARAVARSIDAGFIDTRAALARIQAPWTDGIHLSVSANLEISRVLAETMGGLIRECCCVQG